MRGGIAGCSEIYGQVSPHSTFEVVLKKIEEIDWAALVPFGQ